MREILFRGKSTNNGKWYEGDLYQSRLKSSFYISYYNAFGDRISAPVIPATVGQYTGLTDKNGTKIFEGDIVKHFNNSDEEYDIGVIYFDTEFMGWRRTTQGRFHKIKIDTYKLNPTCIYEIIGNIHDNPELLKGGV